MESIVRSQIKDYDELEEILASFLKEGRDSDEEDENQRRKERHS